MATTSRGAIGIGAILLLCLGSTAGAAEDKSARTTPPGQGQSTGGTDSVGAGGLTGSAATKDGARTGTADRPRPAGSPAPAAGTAR